MPAARPVLARAVIIKSGRTLPLQGTARGNAGGSSPTDTETSEPLPSDTLPEWSKGVDSSSTSASCVGSNPTGVSLQRAYGVRPRLGECAVSVFLRVPRAYATSAAECVARCTLARKPIFAYTLMEIHCP